MKLQPTSSEKTDQLLGKIYRWSYGKRNFTNKTIAILDFLYECPLKFSVEDLANQAGLTPKEAELAVGVLLRCKIIQKSKKAGKYEEVLNMPVIATLIQLDSFMRLRENGVVDWS